MICRAIDLTVFTGPTQEKTISAAMIIQMLGLKMADSTIRTGNTGIDTKISKMKDMSVSVTPPKYALIIP